MPDDADAGAEEELEALFGGARVDVDRLRWRRLLARRRADSTIFLTSDSVSRTDRLRAMTSRAMRR